MCKNSIKYRTDVAISAKYMKDVGCSALKICGFEIDAIIIVVLLKKHKPGFIIICPMYCIIHTYMYMFTYIHVYMFT